MTRETTKQKTKKQSMESRFIPLSAARYDPIKQSVRSFAQSQLLFRRTLSLKPNDGCEVRPIE